MTSTYDRTKDPYALATNESEGVRTARLGRQFPKAKAITPSDTVDLAHYAGAVVVTSIAGGATLKVLPAQNDDADTVSFAGVPVGFVTPFQVRRVFATGTLASVASLDA